jgi:hypothetical protein
MARRMIVAAKTYYQNYEYYPFEAAAEFFREHKIHLAVMALNNGLDGAFICALPNTYYVGRTKRLRVSKTTEDKQQPIFRQEMLKMKKSSLIMLISGIILFIASVALIIAALSDKAALSSKKNYCIERNFLRENDEEEY